MTAGTPEAVSRLRMKTEVIVQCWLEFGLAVCTNGCGKGVVEFAKYVTPPIVRDALDPR